MTVRGKDRQTDGMQYDISDLRVNLTVFHKKMLNFESFGAMRTFRIVRVKVGLFFCMQYWI